MAADRRWMRAACVSAAIALLVAAAARGAEDRPPRPPIPKPPPPFSLEIEAPLPDTVIGAEDGQLLVSGRALAEPTRGGRFDVMAIVDTSSSTHAPAGTDVDGDGLLGEMRFRSLARFLPLASSDPGDSVLAAEVAAVRTLLGQLDPASTRVGVISFAGDAREKTPDARVVAPLTDDYARVEAALDRLLAAGPRGRTNMQDSVLLAARELTGGRGALSRPRRDARRIALMLTDGDATLPDPTSRPRSARLAIRAADLAGSYGIRIDSFAVGPRAIARPWVTAEMARVTRGVFTPVERPGDLSAAFQDVRFTDIRMIEVENRTTGLPAEQVRLDSDGWFGALVALIPGRNRIEVRAHASDGRRVIRTLDVQLLPGAAAQELTPRLMARRTRVLESRLAQTRNQTLQLEAEKRERLRRELEEKMRARRRSLTRRIEIDGGASPAPAPH